MATTNGQDGRRRNGETSGLPSRAQAARRRVAEETRRETRPAASTAGSPAGTGKKTGGTVQRRSATERGIAASAHSPSSSTPTSPRPHKGGSARTGAAPRPATRTSTRTASSPQRRKGTAKRAGAQGKKKRSWGRIVGLGIVMTFLGAVIAGAATFLIMYASLEIPKADQVALAQTTTVYYSDGTTEMGRMSQVNRTIVDASALPDYVPHAVVASEDRTFYTNSGIDLKGIGRALINNLMGGARQGASTLTQQYVERYYEGERTGYVGKAKEAILALKINREQSKDEVIGNYLNTIYFGRGAYGIEAASRAFFNHPASELTLSEAALLAGIIPAPSAWDPAVDEEQARTRWERVLKLMVEDGWISAADAASAQFPTTVDPDSVSGPSMEGPTGYLMEQIRTELTSKAGFTDDQLTTGGYKIISTIDKVKQDQAIAAAEYMNEIRGWNPEFMHVALSSLNPANGEIVAEYGGADYLKRQQNAATQDIAAAGSTFKLFTLLANAEQGGKLTDVYNGSSPQTFAGLRVQNDSGVSWGRVNLVSAMQNSVNTAFVALNEKVGPEATTEMAIKAGIPEETPGLESTILNVLGFAATHNIDLARAYSTVASGGLRTNPHIVREVQHSDGSKIYQTTVTPEQVFTSDTVSAIMPALQAVTARGGTAEAVASALKVPSGGKTGTSEEQKSAQFVGFTPELVTAVSMYQSDENGNSVPLSNIGGIGQFHGGDWPVDVWVKYMKAATADQTKTDFDWYKKPSVMPRPYTPTPEPTQEETEEANVEQQPAQQQPTQAPGSQQNSGTVNGGNGTQPTAGTRSGNSGTNANSNANGNRGG